MISLDDLRAQRDRAERELQEKRDEALTATTAARIFAQALHAISAGHPDPIALAGSTLHQLPGWERDGRVIRQYESVGRLDTVIPPTVGITFGSLTEGRWVLIPLDDAGDRVKGGEVIEIFDVHKHDLILGNQAKRGIDGTYPRDFPYGFEAIPIEQ